LDFVKYNKSDPLNLGSGKEISIKELVNKLLKLTKSNFDIVWETDKPNGQPRRCISIEKARKEIGFEPTIDIDEGLRKTIKWYESTLTS
jgi:GDP-L-fucose synthase